MCANSNAQGHGQLHRSTHHAWVARMQTAGNIGRRDMAEQSLDVSKLIDAKRFADVRVQIDGHFLVLGSWFLVLSS
jgi:hypothetical protein